MSGGIFSLNIRSIGMQFAVQCRICPGVTFLSADNTVLFNEHFLLLVRRYVPTKVIRVRNKEKPLFASSIRLIFGGPVVALGLTGKSLSAVK